MDLTNKQQVFVEEYLKCWNATKAARVAGYSEKYLHTNASKLLQNTTIQAEIERRLKEKQLTADMVLARIGEQATSNITDFATVKTADDLTELDNGYLVKKFERTIITDSLGRQKEKIKLELYDAQSALRDIGKHHGLWDNDVGSSEDKPFIVKVVYGDRDNGTVASAAPETD